MTDVLLQVRNLKVAYGRIEAVRSVDLEVRRGEFVSIIGSNGAGKTSAMRAICGAKSPSAGSITFDGGEIAGLPSHAVVSKGLAMVPEGRHIFGDQTVEDNLILGAYLRRGRSQAQLAADTSRVLDLFPVLRARLHQAAGTLSGGEQQMLAIARSLLSQPTLLIVDELSLGLAPMILDLLFPVLVDLNRAGLSILLVEQMASYALQVTHRTYVMEHGSVLIEGDSEALIDDPRILETYLGNHGS